MHDSGQELRLQFMHDSYQELIYNSVMTEARTVFTVHS
jgi:hypothetical protein